MLQMYIINCKPPMLIIAIVLKMKNNWIKKYDSSNLCLKDYKYNVSHKKKQGKK